MSRSTADDLPDAPSPPPPRANSRVPQPPAEESQRTDPSRHAERSERARRCETSTQSTGDGEPRPSAQPRRVPWSAWLSLAAGATIFGSATPVSKIIVDQFPPILATWMRIVIGGLVLLPFIWTGRAELRGLNRRGWLTILGIAAFGMIGFSLALLYGMERVSGVAGSAVMSTAPAAVAVGAAIFLHERFGWRKILAVALAVAGVAVVNLTGESMESRGGQLGVGIGLVFAAVLCEAAYTLLGKQAMRQAHPLPVAGLASLIAAVAMAPVGLWQMTTTFDAADTSWAGWLAMSWWSIGSFALGTWLWYRGVAGASGVAAGAFMGLMPASALIFSYLLLREPFHWVHVVGFALVLSGIGTIAWAHHQQAAANDDGN